MNDFLVWCHCFSSIITALSIFACVFSSSTFLHTQSIQQSSWISSSGSPGGNSTLLVCQLHSLLPPWRSLSTMWFVIVTLIDECDAQTSCQPIHRLSCLVFFAPTIPPECTATSCGMSSLDSETLLRLHQTYAWHFLRAVRLRHNTRLFLSTEFSSFTPHHLHPREHRTGNFSAHPLLVQCFFAKILCKS